MSKNKFQYTSTELHDKINQLSKFYLPMDLNSAYRRSKLEAIKELKYIFNHTKRRSVQDSDFTQVLLCALTVIYFFGMKLRFSYKYFNIVTKRDFKKAEACFQKTIDILLPERFDMTIQVTLRFFDDVSLWQFESFCSKILDILLFFSKGEMKLANYLLTDIHYVIYSDVPSARHRIRVLYELLKSEHWNIDKHKLLPLITRFLDFFAKSDTTYTYVQKGFEVCLKRIFEKVENRQRLSIIATMLNWFNMVKLCESDVLKFSLLLDRAAQLYDVGAYSDCLYDGLVNHVMKNLLTSEKSSYCLIGSRLLQMFLDRHGNVYYLTAPTIFYEFSQVKLMIGIYDSGDKSFIRHHRETIHVSVLKAFKSHSQNSVIIKALYIIICCLVLEVPCGLTAAAVACLLMSVQDVALNEENLSPTARYWMHAIVVSVMSLICWVHKSTVLYSYVNQIISRRAQEAPQLNPPLKQVYNVGHHQVTWNKPTLFFEDWELRYGMWKHFTNKVDRHSLLLKKAISKK